jgi:tryptophanyl-tRNA synthetase
MSLRDGSKKMSKSDPSDHSRINLTDDADAIAQKIARPRPIPSRCRATTRPRSRPEADNLVGIYAALRTIEGRRAEGVRRRTIFDFQGRPDRLAVAKLGPITAEMQRLVADPLYRSVLADGSARPRRSPPKR